jgi:hypothetical protein
MFPFEPFRFLIWKFLFPCHSRPLALQRPGSAQIVRRDGIGCRTRAVFKGADFSFPQTSGRSLKGTFRRPEGFSRALLVEDKREQGLVYLNPAAVVFNEAQLSEFVHEEIHARTRRADDLRQNLLGYIRQFAFWLMLRCPVAAEHEQRPGQAFLTRIEELID